jgi:hypothetical protein
MSISRRLVATAAVVAALAFPLGVLASHTFTDVPTSSTFHADIEAIADAGVTTGCATGKYCPEDFVTREQMAAFLNRLGALGTGKEPVVNAARLDGFAADDLSRTSGGTVEDDLVVPTAPQATTYTNALVDAPVDGYLIVNASITFELTGSTSGCVVTATLRHTTTDATSHPARQTIANGFATVSLTQRVAVGSGVAVVALEMQRSACDGTLTARGATITGHFSPFDEG